MFTGIVDHLGKILEISSSSAGIRLNISCRFSGLTEGESISVDGACLTVVAPGADFFSCDLSPETLQLTIASEYRPGTMVNLERPLKLDTPLGGHWVTGHVDQSCRLKKRHFEGEYLNLTFGDVSPLYRSYLSRKGSVTVNGVSLTVNSLTEDGFSVMLIPHTLEITNLGFLTVGDRANLELDWMAKLVVDKVREVIRSEMDSVIKERSFLGFSAGQAEEAR